MRVLLLERYKYHIFYRRELNNVYHEMIDFCRRKGYDPNNLNVLECKSLCDNIVRAGALLRRS